MKESDHKFIETWENQVKKGKRKYLLKNGIGWGVWMFIFTEIANYLFEIRPVPGEFKEYVFLFIWWLSGGFLFSYFTWYFQKKKYNKLMNRKTEVN